MSFNMGLAKRRLEESLFRVSARTVAVFAFLYRKDIELLGKPTFDPSPGDR